VTAPTGSGPAAVDFRRFRPVTWAVRVDGALLAMGAAGGGLVVAYLVATARWYVAAALLFALPMFVLLHRRPLFAVSTWLLLGPLVAVTESGGIRMAYWVVHRALPLAALLALVTGRLLRLRQAALPRCGLPELLMLGYAIATVLSILYTSEATVATLYLFYDNVVVSMCLYLVLRLLEPGEDFLRRLTPIVAFLLLSQSLVGVLSWTAPGVLPAEWLTKLGERTTGTLRAPEVFGAVVIFCGLYLLHVGFPRAGAWVGPTTASCLFCVALVMVFMSFSRSVWVAGLLVSASLLIVYRHVIGRLLLVAVPVAAIVLGSGLLSQQIRYATERLDSEQSEESALSRLPVMLAAVRMFEDKPVQGWGYANFDRFDRDYQGRVGNLVYAEKDHASHNLYLTTLAEQGVVGFALMTGPSLIWLNRTVTTWPRLPRSGLIGRRLVATLWMALGAIFVVNNFYRFQFGFAIGIWWLILGLLASVVDRHRVPRARAVGGSAP
jgi:O-antigen ligase